MTLTRADKTPEIDTSQECVLHGGDVCDWNGAPVQFRFAADEKRLAKLVRNCETLELWSYAFGHGMTLQKGPLQTYIKEMLPEGSHVACIFNGLALMIFGPIGYELTTEELEGREPLEGTETVPEGMTQEDRAAVLAEVSKHYKS